MANQDAPILDRLAGLETEYVLAYCAPADDVPQPLRLGGHANVASCRKRNGHAREGVYDPRRTR